MDEVLQVITNGPVLLLTGIVLLVFGGAGLFATGGAGFTRLRTTKPIVHMVQLAFGVLLAAAGLAIITS